MKTTNLDIIIIGAGPIGIACALECKKRNWNYLVIEKGALTNSLFNYPLNMTFFSTSEKLEIDNIPFISNNPKPTRNEALEYYRRVVTSNQLNIKLYEEVSTIKKANDDFKIETSKNQYKAKKVIIATGFYDIPNLLNVPGEDLPKVFHYYKEAHPFTLQNIAIVGASNSSVDAALEIYRKGGNVTMIVRGESIGERVKYWVRPDILNRIEEGSIKAYFNSEITKIEEHQIIIKTPEGNKKLPNDYVIALTGYQPNFKFLDQAGIKFSEDKKHIPNYNPDTMESNVEGLYLAGVICGGMETHKWFIENSRIHAKLIAEDIASKS
ncbi:putative YpdA family bacillithiol system oxidoreductase [Mesoflavibacter sabulilitoris]|uniref:YpdA family putative bacillithiol disulfide reductase n=1 Tax=Mesoflavibacter zeaxanthinifaciens subsp. sabulilitoris TaxID=1520893 RepID=A0A2T1NAP9_9FLAO|nr:YpdA family putative bacillithiol disulfide reductase [Mesoflavibacter zeaxanthinifaciens]MBB3123692.1 putative YpdA family bacillithiol system oxidoreductase [Mesoflavibacter zeaxanthinifaciens subsp. sabulilitoris]PSG89185.1 YpdA family putative bacillithiol disulfide reductase [Mesoflavibacter zeaxanthinifaciens subsp. sabulilitoris]